MKHKTQLLECSFLNGSILFILVFLLFFLCLCEQFYIIYVIVFCVEFFSFHSTLEKDFFQSVPASKSILVSVTLFPFDFSFPITGCIQTRTLTTTQSFFFCFQVLCKCFFMLRESSMKIKTLTISVFVLLFFFCKKNIYWNLIARNEHNANVNSFVIVEAKEIKRLFSFNWNQNHIKNSIAKKMSRSCFC